MNKQIKSLENVLKQFGKNMNKEDKNNLKKLVRELKMLGGFKFKHRGSSYDYTAKLKNGLYEISWMEKGEKKTTTYSIEKTNEYIEKGIWIIEEAD